VLRQLELFLADLLQVRHCRLLSELEFGLDELRHALSDSVVVAAVQRVAQGADRLVVDWESLGNDSTRLGDRVLSSDITESR
jgi:hypothetical protein